jgi:hypothetical protein
MSLATDFIAKDYRVNSKRRNKDFGLKKGFLRSKLSSQE